MKSLLLSISVIIILASCKAGKAPVVSTVYVDSLLAHYNASAAIKANDDDIAFWKGRISTNTPQFLEPSKYSAALKARFALLGNIADLQKGDSILLQTSAAFNNMEASVFMSLASHYITEHRFREADSMFQLAKSIGLKKYESYAGAFDVDFELGRTGAAEADLKFMYNASDFGYQFRQSKMMHYKGDLDSSIKAMQAAAILAGPDISLKQIALANVGDLYIHAGDMNKAYDCYVQCIQMNAADLHSIMGIGWIALVRDKNDPLAEKIFSFVASKTASPEPLYKLAFASELNGDSIAQLKFAKAFAVKAEDTLNGNMYHKYLLQFFTGILHEPAKALAITEKELLSRATPQTYAWYAWALLNNNKADEAYAVYEKHIAGKPLEGLELYWTGKLMKRLGKGYNAQQFFEQAKKNEFDLSPAIVKDLEKESVE